MLRFRSKDKRGTSVTEQMSPNARVTLLLLFYVVSGSSLPSQLVAAGRGEGDLPLIDGRELFHQSLRPGEERRYGFGELQASANYEVRISYLSTNPATFDISLEAPMTSKEDRSPLLRRALNTERMVVETDADGNVLGSYSPS